MADVIGTISAVVGLLTTASQAAKFLTSVVKNAKDVDTSVLKLCKDVELMQRNLSRVRDILQDMPPTAAKAKHMPRVLRDVTETCKECKTSVDALRGIFDALQRNPTTSGPQSILKELKLRFKDDDISKLQISIWSYHQTLQTSLKLINILISYQILSNSSQAADRIDRFEGLLEDLRNSMDYLSSHVAREEADLQQTQTIDGQASNVVLRAEFIQRFRNFKTIAKPILSDASALSERMTNASCLDENESPRTEIIDSWRTEVGQSDCIGPEIGPFPENQSVTERVSLDHAVNEPGEAGETVAVPKGKLEVRQRLIDRGIENYTRGLYQTANNCFTQAGVSDEVEYQDSGRKFTSGGTLQRWKRLSEIRARNHMGPARSRLPDSRDDLIELPKLPKDSDVTRRHLDACLDASILLYQGHVELAEKICEEARENLLRLKGADSQEYHDAVLLLVEILFSRGAKELANEWCAEIPIKTLEARFNALKTVVILSQEEPLGVTLPALRFCLSAAVVFGHFPAVLYLLRKHPGADLRRPKTYADKPWRFTAKNVPTDVSAYDSTQLQCMHIWQYLNNAVESDSLAVISLLLQRHRDLEDFESWPGSHTDLFNHCLFCVIRDDNKAVLALLLDQEHCENTYSAGLAGQDFSTCYALPTLETATMTPLEHAIAMGSVESAKLLLRQGFPVVRESNGESALHIAIRCPSGRSLVPLLLDARANPNARYRNVYPLGMAIYHSGRTRRGESSNTYSYVSRRLMVQRLLDAGADPDLESYVDGRTISPIDQAARAGLKEIMKLLKDYGAMETSSSRSAVTKHSAKKSKSRRWWPG